MKKTLKIIAIFASVFFATFLQVDAQQKNAEKANKPALENVKPDYSRSQIMDKIDEIYNTLKSEKEDSPLLPTQYSSFMFQLKNFIEYPELEKKTQIHKDWFVKLGKILKAMEECRTKQEVAKMNKDAALYAKSKEYYAKCFVAFEEAYKNPIKLKTTSRSSGR